MVGAFASMSLSGRHGHPFCLFEDDSITTDRTGGGLREAGLGCHYG